MTEPKTRRIPTWKEIALTSIVGNICFAASMILGRIIEWSRP